MTLEEIEREVVSLSGRFPDKAIEVEYYRIKELADKLMDETRIEDRDIRFMGRIFKCFGAMNALLWVQFEQKKGQIEI